MKPSLFSRTLIVVGLALFLASCGPATSTTDDKNVITPGGPMTISFKTPKKSAHYESNAPEHGATLPAAPINVVIDFNFDLAKPSAITIDKDGKDYGMGETTIDSNKLVLRRAMDPQAPDGTYTVNYKACWPDGSCHDGMFQFAIDRRTVSAYTDLRTQKQVTVKMSDIKFKPEFLRISKGTKVTWINDEEVEHYVNTDSHPAHTYYRGQNSRSLKKGESYSVTFDKAGVYPYHCSAHASSMIASLLVE